jgi:hypothetical protein
MFLLATLLACADAAMKGARETSLDLEAAPAQRFGSCEGLQGDAGGLEDDDAPSAGRVLYADGVTATLLPADSVEVVTEPVRWAEIRAGTGWRRDDMPEVDLGVTWLLVAHGYAEQSCSMGVSAVDAWSVGEMALQVEIAFEDRSGACEVTCDAEAHAVVVLAVPAGTEVFACARTEATCAGG